MSTEERIRIALWAGTLMGTRSGMIEYYKAIMHKEPITGKIIGKSIDDLQSAINRLRNLINAPVDETVNRPSSADDAPIFRSVKDEDDGKEK